MAAAPRSSQTPLSSIPTQPKKSGVFSSSSLSRRTSLGSSTNIPQGIGYSPGPTNTPNTPAGSGIPAFRTLRSFLPFGPNKNATPTPATTAASPSSSRSPFSGFGSVRKSMTKERERNVSLSNDALSPVIAIDRPTRSETPIRRSVSLSTLDKPLPSEPSLDESSDPFRGKPIPGNHFGLRTPSPGPPLSAELSTIIEADSSGVSKHPPGTSTPSDSRSPSPPNGRDFLPAHLTFHKHQSSIPDARPPPNSSAATHLRQLQHDLDAETSALDLSTTNVADQVRSALLAGDSSPNSVKQWRDADKAVVIIDADEHEPNDLDNGVDPDASFNLDTADPELVALLTPNSLAGTISNGGSSHSPSRKTSGAHHLGPRPSTSPTTPTFPASRLPRARQASSFLPRLQPNGSYSPSPSPTTRNFSIPTPSPTTPSANAPTPKASPARHTGPTVPFNGNDSPPTSPISGGGAHTSTPAATRTAKALSLAKPATRLFTPNRSSSLSASQSRIFGNKQDVDPSIATPAKSRGPARTLRQVVLGVTNSNNRESEALAPPSPTETTSNITSSHSRPSLDIRRQLTSSSEIGLGRPPSASLDIRRGGSFDARGAVGGSRKRDWEFARQASSSPERTAGLLTATPLTRTSTAGSLDVESLSGSSPSPEVPSHDSYYRPSFDSMTSATRPSLESNTRPGSRLRERERDRERHVTPSLRVIDASSDRISPIRDTSPLLPSPSLRIPALNRSRKRSMSVQERPGQFSGLSGGENSGGMLRPGSSLSAHGGRMVRGSHRGMTSSSEMDLSSSVGSNSGGGPKLEWLGPRTVKAFRAAGLLDFDREKEHSSKERDRDDSPTTDRLRDRSGSISGVLAPSPLGNGANGNGGSLSLSRFGSLRTTSEYNPTPSRAHSRMAFSEIGGSTARRGSESLSVFGGSASAHGHGLMESPTFTTLSSGSRGDRDTPRSISTAATSVSDAFGYFGRERDARDRDRDRDREELRDLRDKHGTEMAALLNALSDSQRTVRNLREENTDLRDRLEQFGRVVEENGELRRVCADLEQECLDLRGDVADMRRDMASSMRQSLRAPGLLVPSWSGSSTSSGVRTPIPKPATSSPLTMVVTPRYEDEEVEYDNTMIIHDSIDHEMDEQQDNYHKAFRPPSSIRRSVDSKTSIKYPSNGLLDDHLFPSSESTPSIKRRLSSSSSIFPIPPSNMTMLLDDDVYPPAIGGDSNRSSIHSHLRTPSLPPPTSPQSTSKTPTNTHITTPKAQSRSRSSSFSSPVTFKTFAIPTPFQPNKANVSGVSISPTTADFSMVTGSPRSLFLRPEHELLLGDMESLDLGARGPAIDLEIGNGRGDDW
ncbi:hypothetical protein CPB83DRAFT_908588 [Crepidotus variabilis]|uniref:Uncharacterized protein n=1 Tax=Crepidotus variabilis TaxID=179855 RepID=A0A9P6JMV0_9AGAR|nr:hypothetical protein CPB83DRAFT_908588 [Crepidotus variabilis]